jgi:hypothetical protein
MSTRTARLTTLTTAVWLACTTGGLLTAAERIELREDAADSRIRKVEIELAVNGKLFPEPGPEKALKLEVEAAFDYTERRLAGTGRDAQALRGIRHYDLARASIQAGGQTSNVLLRQSVRLLVAQGQLDGVDLFSPSGPLTYSEVELLRIPGDSLAIVGLLPDSAVEADESWKPAHWVVPLLTGVEAVEKHDLVCRLASVSSVEAVITFTGDVTGATVGAASALHIEGRAVYDRKQNLVTRLELTQTEKRSIGAVSPGLDVAAKTVLTRSLVARPARLTDDDLAGLSLEANEANRLLMFDAPAWNTRFYHDRRWHLFHQTSESALLRLLDGGGLITQCNIKKLPDAEPGQHVSEEQFLADIERTLGKNFGRIEQTEKLKLKDNLFVFRVIVSGTVERRNAKNEPEPGPMQWNYYLVAHADGRQIAFVFSLDPRQAEELENRDLAIVAGLEFLAARPRPEPAVKRTGGK